MPVKEGRKIAAKIRATPKGARGSWLAIILHISPFAPDVKAVPAIDDDERETTSTLGHRVHQRRVNGGKLERVTKRQRPARQNALPLDHDVGHFARSQPQHETG